MGSLRSLKTEGHVAKKKYWQEKESEWIKKVIKNFPRYSYSSNNGVANVCLSKKEKEIAERLCKVCNALDEGCPCMWGSNDVCEKQVEYIYSSHIIG